jgi:hypothetical protein
MWGVGWTFDPSCFLIFLAAIVTFWNGIRFMGSMLFLCGRANRGVTKALGTHSRAIDTEARALISNHTSTHNINATLSSHAGFTFVDDDEDTAQPYAPPKARDQQQYQRPLAPGEQYQQVQNPGAPVQRQQPPPAQGQRKNLKTSNVGKYPLNTQVGAIGDGSMNGWWVVEVRADNGGNTGAGSITLSNVRPF